ncbi:uncharacterized protein [Porites lutea]|uniref:uncharacterized protein n=1 Tax=Porites lutea TaxID=51062 RepID=UPI003CC686DF
MEFKTFTLYFAVFVVVTPRATVCKCRIDEKKDTVSKYKCKLKDGDKDLDETIKIDSKKETETFQTASNGGTSPDVPGEVEVIYDFKQNMTMHRMSIQKACFLSESTDNLPKPADLKRLLERQLNQDSSQVETQGENEYAFVGTLDDRSFLSDEMAAVCANLPIHLIKQKIL